MLQKKDIKINKDRHVEGSLKVSGFSKSSTRRTGQNDKINGQEEWKLALNDEESPIGTSKATQKIVEGSEKKVA